MNSETSAAPCPSNWCPLNRIRAGTSVRIRELRASSDLRQRLREIGFGEDQIIRPVISQANIICQVCHARLAVSAQLAQMILVEPLPFPAG